MKQTGKLALLLTTLTILTTSQLHAQLYGIGHNIVLPVQYKDNVTKKFIDFIYAYNETPANWNTKSGTLKAITPDSTKGWTCTFRVFDMNTKNYHDSIQFTDSSRVFSNLKSGGYCVTMHKDTIDTVFRAWVFINKMRFYLIKDTGGYVKEFEYTCEYVDIRGISKTDKKFADSLRFYHEDFKYFNPNDTTHKPYTFINVIKNSMKGSDGSFSENNKIQQRIIDAPPTNTNYTVTLTDTFGNSITDNIKYKSINTRADFEIYVDTLSMLDPYVRDTVAANYKKLDTDPKDEAPFHAMFTNKSKNGISFEWLLTDTFPKSGIIDSAHYFTNDSISPVFHVYRIPHKHQLKLVSTSPYGCVDTSEVKTLEVEDSQMGEENGDGAFPTAFKPNDEKNYANRYFYFKSNLESEKPQIEWKSLKKIHLWIFNKMGHKMYEYEGPVWNGWQGWDGKTGWGLDAVSGVYYYIFEAEGWGGFSSKSTDPNSSSTTTKGSNYIKGKGYFFLYRN